MIELAFVSIRALVSGMIEAQIACTLFLQHLHIKGRTCSLGTGSAAMGLIVRTGDCSLATETMHAMV